MTDDVNDTFAHAVERYGELLRKLAGHTNGCNCELCQAYEAGKRAGMEEGIRRYAWWKDGVQYVGTCGTTLKQALVDVERGDGDG